ncbi:MAG: OmpA family protein [Desulfobacterales bacterium]
MALQQRQWIERTRPRAPQGWLTTFNDLITLLMVFFVLVFALSSVDLALYRDAFADLQSGEGMLEAGRQTAVGVRPDDNPGTPDAGAQNESQEILDELIQDPEIQTDAVPAGIAITIGSQILFDPAVAELEPAGLPLLAKIARVLGSRPGLIRIEGHTDNLPINTPRYPSNWELSAARAVNVLKYFAESGEIEPRRLAAVGYGASKPLGPNETLQQRARNRRVEIVLVKEGS